MLNNLNDNLTPQNCGNQQSYGMLTKRIKALEDTVSGYSELVSSQKGQFDDLEAQNGKISTLKTISTETDILNADSVRTGILQSGTTSLGDTTVKSLKISGPEGIVTDIDHADIKTADIGDLHVSGEITLDQPTLDRLELREDLKAKEVNTETVKIKNKKALETLIQELSIGTDFKNINFKSDMIPTWNNLELATKSDVSGLNFKSVVEAAENLPEVAAPGDLYWISSTAEVAVYSDGGFTLTPMPALAAYRTAAEEDKINVEIQANIDKANTDTNARVDETNKNVSTLDTRLTNAQIENDKTHEALTAAIDANKATITTAEGRLKVIEDDYVKNAPSDGNMYGMKDGSWQDLAKDSNFVPKEYKDETTDSHIFNDANGIDISSNKSVTVSTPEEKLETSKEIVNVDYMRKNLSISKSGAVSDETELYWKVPQRYYENTIWPDMYTNGTSYNSMPDFGLYSGFKDNVLFLKDYIIYGIDKGGNTPVQDAATGLVAVSRDAEFHFLSSPHHTGFGKQTRGYRTYTYKGFNLDYCKDHPEVANMYYLAGYKNRFVELWDGTKYVGEIRLPDEVETDWNVSNTASIADTVYMEPLKDVPVMMLYMPKSQVGYILGVNNDGELDPLACKRCPLPGFPGALRLAGGGHYWWGLNHIAASRNLMMRIDWQGNTSASPLQAEDGSGSVSSTDCYDQNYCWQTLKNGDVIFAVNAKFAGASEFTTGFIYCYEDQGMRLQPVYYINSTYLWNTSTGTFVCPSANRPMWEIGNYVFFFPTVGSGIKADKGTISGTATYDNTKTEDMVNTYCIINKTSHNITYATAPFQMTTAIAGGIHGYMTKGGYLWVFPARDAETTYNGKVLVISPTGAQQTIDLGTGDKHRFQGPAQKSGWSSSWQVTMGYFQSIVVNKDGIGVALATDNQAILVFYGNGEYKITEFDSNQSNGYWSKTNYLLNTAQMNNGNHYFYPNVPYTLSAGLFVLGSSVCYWNTDTSDDYDFLKIDVNKESPLLPPMVTHTGFGHYANDYTTEAMGAYEQDMLFDYRLQQNRLTEINLLCSGNYADDGQLIVGVRPLKDADTIYLKDGEYVISDTSGTNYKKSIEETK